MLPLMIQKELKAVITSPKFTATFAVCAILLLLSVFIGIQEYQQAEAQHDMAVRMAEESMRSQSNWSHLGDKTYREPNAMQILVSGLSYDIGRWSAINESESVKLKNSAYSDDPIFAIFRFIDFSFIVQIVFSLFAILFTFDAINGERENGTLRLIFSNSVPRAKYLLAKCIGSWLGLVVPLSIPILLSILLINIFGVNFTSDEWIRVVLLIGLSLVYVSLFIVLGVFLSSLTRRSSVSFLLSLVIWVAFVLIIPRTGVMAAGQIANIPSLGEVEGKRDAFANNRWAENRREMEDRLKAQHGWTQEGDEEEMDEAALWAQMLKEDAERKKVQKEIEDYEARLMEDWRQRKKTQRALGFTLSRFSPAAAYQLAATTLAATDIDLKERAETAMRTYREEFTNYVDRKQSESGQMGGVMISITNEGIDISSSRDNSGLDISDRPRYTPPKQRLAEIVEPVIIDIGLLLFGLVGLFAAAFVSFQRYDLR